MMSEKIELLGKGCYENIPDELTIKSMPTSSELDYVGAEDFNETMLTKILPKCIEENIDFNELLEIDFHWICRALRILNYGPYHTTNAIFCQTCGQSRGEYQVNLETVACKPLPEGFVNDLVVSKDEFIEFDKDIHLSMFTVRDSINAYKDKAFIGSNGLINRQQARLCYMIKKIGDKNVTPIEAKITVQEKLSPADYEILKALQEELTDYGLRVGGTAQCPICGSKDATFFVLMDDKFFRPTLGDLRKWKWDRTKREDDIVLTDKKKPV